VSPTEKIDATNRFLKGQSVTDVAAFFACHRSQIEQVLREAIWQLAELKAPKPVEPLVTLEHA
jgi:hypothetical protein